VEFCLAGLCPPSSIWVHGCSTIRATRQKLHIEYRLREMLGGAWANFGIEHVDGTELVALFLSDLLSTRCIAGWKRLCQQTRISSVWAFVCLGASGNSSEEMLAKRKIILRLVRSSMRQWRITCCGRGHGWFNLKLSCGHGGWDGFNRLWHFRKRHRAV